MSAPGADPGGSTPPGADADLVARAIAADRDAVRRLWDANRPWVAAIVHAHKPREADVDDLLQDIALTMLRSLPELDDPRAFRAWLRRVSVNAAITAGRRQSIRRTGSLDHPLPDPGDTAPPRDWKDQGMRLMELARQLPEDYREPVLLKNVRDMTCRQIGEILGISERAAETRVVRGRRMLRELAEQGELEPAHANGRGPATPLPVHTASHEGSAS